MNDNILDKKIRTKKNIAIVFTMLFVLLLCTGCTSIKKELRDLQGYWQYDEAIAYEFDGDGNGRMYYDVGEAFEYKYTVQDNVVYLDFELEDLNDCQYTYTIDGGRLILVGGEGTAEIGKEYELTKQEQND